MVENLHSGINAHLAANAEVGFCLVPKRASKSVVTLNQIHGAHGVRVTGQLPKPVEGDFIWTTERNLPVGVLVADCTALLISGENLEGENFVAAIHAGWRGTAAGIIEKSIEAVKLKTAEVWLSPSICQEHFEVGEEVLEKLNTESLRFARSGKSGKFYLDLKAFQIEKLKQFAVKIRNSSLCTYCQPDLVSYRREGPQLSARHLAWIRRGKVPH